MNSIPMTCEISQTFFFDAAHTLDRAIETESSRRIHGHTYNAEVFLTGQPDPQTGMVIQFPLGREPEQTVTADALCIRCTAPATVNAAGYLEFEEG